MVWKVLACGGVLAHAAAGTYSLVGSAVQSQPMSWLLLGAYTFAPVLVGGGVALLAGFLGQPHASRFRIE